MKYLSIWLNRVGKLILGGGFYLLLNNLVINILWFVLYNQLTYRYLFKGWVCKGLLFGSPKASVSTLTFLFLKLLIIYLFVKRKQNYLVYYLIFDALFVFVYLTDIVFGTMLKGHYFSNGPLFGTITLNQSDNYFLFFLYSIGVFVILIRTYWMKNFWKRDS